MATFPHYSKAGRGRRMEEHEAKASNIKEAAPKSWLRAGVENGLRRSKPWWLPMIGGHRLVAKGVGERAEPPEGLYLGCGPRYSHQKRGLGWSSWSRGEEKIKWCVRACFLPLALSSAVILKKWLRHLFPDRLVPLIKILAVYLKKFVCLNCLTVVK